MGAFLLSLVASYLACVAVIRYQRWHGFLTYDTVGSGPQKFHLVPVPRIGGVPLLFGISAGLGCAWAGGGLGGSAFPFLGALLPIVFVGLLEDATKKVSPGARLAVSFLSAGLGYWCLGAALGRVDITVIDSFLLLAPVSLVVTVFMVGGVSHAFNIIDGYNGLSGGTATIVLLALSYLSWGVGDFYLFELCMALVGANIGFLILNYPRGLIFAGDGGAYLWGFTIAEISLLLVQRNPEISAWFPIVLVIYPVWETIFSVYRRLFVRKIKASLPDALHLHHLIYRRLIRLREGRAPKQAWYVRNSSTSLYLWMLTMVTAIFGVLFSRRPEILMTGVVCFIAFYVWLYTRIACFRTPKGLLFLADLKIKRRSSEV